MSQRIKSIKQSKINKNVKDVRSPFPDYLRKNDLIKRDKEIHNINELKNIKPFEKSVLWIDKNKRKLYMVRHTNPDGTDGGWIQKEILGEYGRREFYTKKSTIIYSYISNDSFKSLHRNGKMI